VWVGGNFHWNGASDFSLQSLAERLRRVPGLFIAHVSVAHGRADVLMPEKLLDLPQVLPYLVEKDCGGAMAQPMRRNLPHPDHSARRAQP
jgi:hypothetical protein